MFATLNLERDPLKLSDMLRGMADWVQDAGGFSLALLLILMLWARARWPGGLSAWLWGALSPENPRRRWAPALFNLVLWGAGFGYAVAGLLRLVDLLALRWRLIWGIARLSFKEAIRGKVLYVCSAMVLVLLFLNWFVPSKRETQLQNYVTIVSLSLTPLMI